MTGDATPDLNGETEPAGALGIDRCFCFRTRFADLRGVAAATGARSVAELQQHVTFGRKCRLCHPYVRRMLRTGETVFDTVVTADDEPDSAALSS